VVNYKLLDFSLEELIISLHIVIMNVLPWLVDSKVLASARVTRENIM
jgi:hypothetical protein